jgi:hypothetical protein
MSSRHIGTLSAPGIKHVRVDRGTVLGRQR